MTYEPLKCIKMCELLISESDVVYRARILESPLDDETRERIVYVPQMKFYKALVHTGDIKVACEKLDELRKKGIELEEWITHPLEE